MTTGESIRTITLFEVHKLYAETLGPLLIEACARWGEPAQAQEALRALHTRAASGAPIAETDWAAALEPALRQIYRHAYPYAQAYAAASADASAYASAHGYSATEARQFGDSYAEMNTDANARVHAEANAVANAAATAAAFATGDLHAYAATYPSARLRAAVLACAGGDAARLQSIWDRLGTEPLTPSTDHH
ncbi:hypothetical protein AB0M22_38265 [Nocardia sp. NPDC051756]|uniref:hypothetical protein n=1 Tax=Nocardia sp. NPDC051756 TaxID=3154751 RepID=UPI0034398204